MPESASSGNPATSRLSSPWKLAAIVGAIVGLLALSRLLPVGEWLQQFLETVRGLGPMGYLLFILAYIVTTVAFLPGSILTLGSGAVFGLAGGFVAVSVGSTLGAAGAFLVGRFLARDMVASRVAGNPKFAAIDQAVGREGFKIVLLTRLSPVFPFNLLNYAYGLTRVPFWTYLLASWIGMMPGTVLYVYLGATASEIAGAGPRDAGGVGLALQIVGLLATIAVTVVITRVAKRALARSTSEADQGMGV